LGGIVEAIENLSCAIEHPPASPWRAPAWLVEQYRRFTCGEAGLRKVEKSPTHAWLIQRAADEVLNRLTPPDYLLEPTAPQITESSLDREDKLTLIGLRRRLLGPSLGFGFGLGHALAQDPGEALEVLSYLRTVLGQLIVAATDRAAFTAAALRGQTRADLPARPPRRRCRLRIARGVILLDGEPVPLDVTAQRREDVLCFFRHLLRMKGDWISGPEIDRAEDARGSGSLAGMRWDRIRLDLPECLAALVESKQRAGHRLAPAAWRN
jgi:hypothetical protein